MPHSIDAEQDDDRFKLGGDGSGAVVDDTGCSIAVMANHNNLSGAEYQESSSGVSSSSSDDEEGGSLDSYQSDKNSLHSSSPNGLPSSGGRRVTSPVLNIGIEVKDCRSEELRGKLVDEAPETTGATAATEKEEDGDAGGRLRFYLDGRCVLELRHDWNNEGLPQQWVQSYGKTYRSSIATIPTSSIPAWQPLESHQDAPEESLVSSPSLVVQPNKKKPFNNFYATFFVRNRREANLNLLPFCLLRKAARRPGESISKDMPCPHERICRQRHSAKQQATTYLQRSQRLSLSVGKLAVEKCGESFSDSKSGRKNGSLSCLLMGAFNHETSSDSSRNLQVLIKSASSPAKDRVEVEQSESNKPLPEWYFDPSKATIPVDEMIGNPRPSLLISKVKRPSEEPSSETKKQATEDVEIVDVETKNHQTFSSHCSVAIPRPPSQAKSPSLENSKVSIATAASPLKTASDLSPAVTNAGNSENSQRKKKKCGGYGRGRTIGEAVRTYVISEILNLGGDVRTNYVPRGVFTEVASRYKIDATTTYRWWLKYCNGIRLAAASGNHNYPVTSHKGFLSNRLTAAVPVIAPDHKTKADHFYKEVNSLLHPHVLESSSMKRDHIPAVATGSSLSHGGRYSPRSDDSASSGASLVDPASLYVSSLTLAPHTGVWPAGMPLTGLPNSQLHFQTGRLPTPLNVSVPYLWNCSSEQHNSNGISVDQPAQYHSKGSPLINSEEPLDLTVPKKEKKEGSHNSKIEELKVLNSGLGTYSECQSDQFILRTLLSTHGQPPTAGSNRIVDKEARYSVGKPVAKSLAQRNMKPKHYPFLSLQIGSFEIHSNLDAAQSCERDHFKEIPNKFKVIFTQRKFVYEFETNAEMHLPFEDSNQKESPPSAKRMACIVVPFNIVEAFWCYGATIVLRVLSKPFMFLGRRLKQVGCVPSLTVYETKKSVDLTGGQLSMAHLHKVTLIKPHLIEQLKIYLVLFDVRFRNLISPVAHSLVSADERAIERTQTTD